MIVQTCPTDIVTATPERVWELLTNPAHYASWADARPVDARARHVAVGDRVVLRAGPADAFTVIFEFRKIEPPSELTLDARLPFGIVNHEVVRIDRIDESRCRVTFN
jgi:uncharacterized protein YndB with AHSA1/START domain